MPSQKLHPDVVDGEMIRKFILFVMYHKATALATVISRMAPKTHGNWKAEAVMETIFHEMARGLRHKTDPWNLVQDQERRDRYLGLFRKNLQMVKDAGQKGYLLKATKNMVLEKAKPEDWDRPAVNGRRERHR